MRRNLGRLLGECAFVAAITVAAHAQPLTFTTLAGQEGGPGSVDGTGGAARFQRPYGAATDSSGNIYVADSYNNTIRKITPLGQVTTLAGLAGTAGSADGIGSAARFRKPTGLMVDAIGNVYVSDTNNSTIRKINPAGVVTTIAGVAGEDGTLNGTGKLARFNHPAGLAMDTAGNLFVADDENHTIRKIFPNGFVSTMAGSPGNSGSADGISARFAHPRGVATDSSGNIYVADESNDAIRKITSGGIVTTLAGLAGTDGSADGIGSAGRFRGPNGVATDGSGNIYVADYLNHTIRKVTASGAVTTLAGSAASAGNDDGTGSAARFTNPTAVAVDSAGNVYATDEADNTVRKITPAGVVTTLAGTATLPTGSVDGTGSAARFNTPTGLTTDNAGNVYVADDFNDTVRKITPAGVVTTLAGSPSSSGSADGTGSAARFSDPKSVAADSGGNVYVADDFINTIRKITPAGVVTTFAGSPGVFGSADGTGNAASFGHPAGVATDSGGNVYVAEEANDTIRKITPAGVVTTLAGSASDFSGHEDGPGSTARFRSPNGVATDSSGNVYVTDSSNNTIRKITPAGVVTTLAGSATDSPGSVDGTGSAARFDHPRGVATDSAGNVYVAGQFTCTIRKITPAGVVTTIGGSPGLCGSENGTGSAAHFNVPVGVATDASGNLYVVDRDNNKIRVGRPALLDAATIDAASGPVFKPRQLGTSPQTATSWQWRVIRQPAGSNATFSSTSIRNPVFTPDVTDLYIFQVTASDGVKTSVTTVSLTATPPPKRRAAR